MTMSELISAYNGKLSKTENELDEIRAKPWKLGPRRSGIRRRSSAAA